MSDTSPSAPSAAQKQAQDFAQQMLGFDTMIGPTLVKIVYFLGLAGIGIGVLVAIFAALDRIQYDAIGGLVMIVVLIAGAVIAVLGWRFACELALLAFLMYARMGEIRDRLPAR